MQPLDSVACNSANKPSFQNPFKIFLNCLSAELQTRMSRGCRFLLFLLSIYHNFQVSLIWLENNLLWPCKGQTVCYVLELLSSWHDRKRCTSGCGRITLERVPKNKHIKRFLGSNLTPTWNQWSFLTPADSFKSLVLPMFRA